MLQNVQLIHLQGSTTSRKDLECLPLETYDSILILADEELESSRHTYDMLHADSKSLTCLILIKDIQESIRMEVKKFETKLLKEVEREDALWKTTGPVRHGAPPFVTAVPVSAEEVRATVTLGASDEEHSVPGSPLRTVGKSLSTPAAAAETIALTPACGFKHTLEERRSFVSKLFHLPSSGNGGEDSSSDPVDASMPTHWTAQSKGRSQSLSPSLLQRLHETYYEYAKHAYTVECIASEQHERSSITAEDSSEAVQAAAYAVEATYVSDSPVQRSRKPRRFSQTESSMTPSQQDAGIATPQKLFLHTDSSRRRPSFSDSMMSPSHSSPHSDNAHRPMSRRTLPCRHKSAACLENPFANLKRSNRGKHSALLSEILDSRTKNVISLALASDFVLSNELISMAIAMVSEQREVNCILKELFSGKGNELYVKAARAFSPSIAIHSLIGISTQWMNTFSLIPNSVSRR